MKPFTGELIGTMLLVLLGDGVVAGCLLNRSKAQNGGWIVIATGWGLGVAVAVYAVGRFSGAHINPAVTLSLALAGKFAWANVPGYIAAQMLGAFLGAVLVWLAYLAHWPGTEDQVSKLSVFSTVPAIRRTPLNFVTETIGTFVLVLGVMAIAANDAPIQSGLNPLLVGLLIAASVLPAAAEVSGRELGRIVTSTGVPSRSVRGSLSSTLPR